MSIKRKCQIVMLPTQSKAVRLNQLVIGAGNFLFSSRQSNDIGSLTAYELYITSDEDIKEYDWVYSEGLQYVFQALAFPLSAKDAKKIIATTNTSLGWSNIGNDDTGLLIGNSFKGNGMIVKPLLPQPSQQFIEAYVKAYNEGNPITEVMVEYVCKSNASLGHNEYVYLEHIDGKIYIPIKIDANINQDSFTLGKEEEFEDWEIETSLKVNSNNTININPTKDKWSREEVIEFGLKCVNLGMDLNNNPSSFLNGLSGKDYYYKWIEENL